MNETEKIAEELQHALTHDQLALLATCESEEEFRAAVEGGKMELSDEQLDAVAGGDWIWNWSVWKTVVKEAPRGWETLKNIVKKIL